MYFLTSKQILKFPKEYSSVTSGMLLSNSSILITGHSNGYVVQWTLKDSDSKVLFECGSKVETISVSPSNEIAVGVNSGLLFTFTIDRQERNIIFKASYFTSDRIWKTKWLSNTILLASSTYGVLNLLEKKPDGWTNLHLNGHENSIFGLDCLNDYIASGDYIGKIVIDVNTEEGYFTYDELNIGSNIQGISWYKNESFAVIDKFGHISFFEKKIDGFGWKLAYETNTATSGGTCITFSNDGNMVFAGTATELIQFDVNTLQVEMTQIDNIINIFLYGNKLLVLTTKNLLEVEINKIKISDTDLKYQYSKISLIGHTGSGKTTLASLITSGSIENIESTYGKRVWNRIIPADPKTGAGERRLVFHDHGGQETVLDTFLPFLTDSDIILIFFKKTDQMTFNKALTIRDELDPFITTKTKICFVETFIDHSYDDIDRKKISELIESNKIISCFQVSARSGEGIDEFKKQLMDMINWNDARLMIRSENVENVEKIIGILINEKKTVMTFNEFKQFHDSNFSHIQSITTNHLKFLLGGFSSQGIIEYYPDILDTIIFNDEQYNQLRSKIPTEAEHNDGIVSIKDLEQKFGQTDYIKILDTVYKNYGIVIENDGQRIFPHKLKEKIKTIPDIFKYFFDNSKFKGTKKLKKQNIKNTVILKYMSDLKLKCIDASVNQGIFAWESNSACIYYEFQEVGNLMQESYLQCIYFIGGTKNDRCDRLHKEFLKIINRLYEPMALDTEYDKKKDDTIESFDVALTFADEQRNYVKEVADILTKKGIIVFYDDDQKPKLLAEHLSEFLHQIYSKKSKSCLMFISKEYVNKPWTTHERRSALEKDIMLKGGYIIPVRFDDTEVPGLDGTISYIDARLDMNHKPKKTPNEVAELFLEKFENKK